jgi:hypothetical protein
MKWGVRKSPLEGVSRKTYNTAGKDAAEHTKAKMFYGEGAGTRRKLIKAKVEARSKKDPTYAKAFDHHVANTDMGKRAEQARGQRGRKDAVNYTAKTVRGVKRQLAPAAGTVAALGIAAYVTNPQVRSAVNRTAASSYSKVKTVGHVAWTKASKSKKFRKVWGQVFDL